MAYDGRIMARARADIEQTRHMNEKELLRRRAEVYARVPAVGETEAEITRLMAGVASNALKAGIDAGAAVEKARMDCQGLLDKRAKLIAMGGFPADYIDEIYACAVCSDTGYVLGQPCACLLDAYRRETVCALSSLLRMDGQSFEAFNLDYYDKVPGASGVSPYETMETVYHLCRDYAEDFGRDSVNLLFRGGTGLGKTFLAACIARVVSGKGCSVVYDSAVSVMEAFEQQKFDRGGEGSAETASRVRRYLDCDLMILDDLGTEMTTSFTLSALYTLINGRLIGRGKTIITTNLSEEELRRRYTPQLNSRLEGEYILLNFAGRDIRTIKREMGLR